ncbi:hypothetical protein GA0070615_0082 [Micromonospora aurantiaca]|nr:hypothetical protein GA0070615_0082 [Micromonospora aurantiaca]
MSSAPVSSAGTAIAVAVSVVGFQSSSRCLSRRVSDHHGNGWPSTPASSIQVGV